MTELDDQRRPEPSLSADETVTLLGFLDYQSATLEWKCSGLDAAGLRATVGASTMTLGGLLKHLAFAEDWWFSRDFMATLRRPRGTRSTGPTTTTGTKTRPPTTLRSSSCPSGGMPWPAPVR